MHAQNTKRIAVGRRSLANSERDGSLIHQNRKMRKILRRKNPSQMRITEQKHKRHPHKSLRKCNRKRSQTQWKPVEPKCNIHQTPSTQTRKTPNQVMGIHFNSSPWFRPKESGARLRRKGAKNLKDPLISSQLPLQWNTLFGVFVFSFWFTISTGTSGEIVEFIYKPSYMRRPVHLFSWQFFFSCLRAGLSLLIL